jgi:hypothetical protein
MEINAGSSAVSDGISRGMLSRFLSRSVLVTKRLSPTAKPVTAQNFQVLIITNGEHEGTVAFLKTDMDDVWMRVAEPFRRRAGREIQILVGEPRPDTSSAMSIKSFSGAFACSNAEMTPARYTCQ